MPSNLHNLSLVEAVDLLAGLACASKPLTYAEKMAEDRSDILTALGSMRIKRGEIDWDETLKQITNTVKDNHPISHGLVGTGLGALAGGAGTWLSNRGRPKEERKSLLPGALTGALAGGALGGGIGLARQHWPDGAPASPDKPKPTEIMRNGVPHRFSATSLARNPDLAAQYTGISAPSIIPDTGGGPILDTAARLAARAPLTTLSAARQVAGLPSLWERISGSAARGRTDDLLGGIQQRSGRTATMPATPGMRDLLTQPRSVQQSVADAAHGGTSFLPRYPRANELLHPTHPIARPVDQTLLNFMQSSEPRGSVNQTPGPLAGVTRHEAQALMRAGRNTAVGTTGRIARGARGFALPIAGDVILNYLRHQLFDSPLENNQRELFLNQHAVPAYR